MTRLQRRGCCLVDEPRDLPANRIDDLCWKSIGIARAVHHPSDGTRFIGTGNQKNDVRGEVDDRRRERKPIGLQRLDMMADNPSLLLANRRCIGEQRSSVCIRAEPQED